MGEKGCGLDKRERGLKITRVEMLPFEGGAAYEREWFWFELANTERFNGWIPEWKGV